MQIKPHQIQQFANQKLRLGLCIMDAKVILKYPCDIRSSFYSNRFKK